MPAPAVPVSVVLTVCAMPVSATQRIEIMESMARSQVPPPRLQPCVLPQYPLAFIEPARETGPLHRRSIVACPLGGTLMAGRCAQRQTAPIPTGGGRGSPMFPECAKCPIGAGYRERLVGWVPMPVRYNTAVLSPSQRMAKRARALVGLGDDEPVTYDPLTVASTLSPDDEGMDYTP